MLKLLPSALETPGNVFSAVPTAAFLTAFAPDSIPLVMPLKMLPRSRVGSGSPR
jgi:hypothetical protein